MSNQLSTKTLLFYNIFYILFLLLRSTTTTSTTTTPSPPCSQEITIDAIIFTNDTYTGYISENLNQQQSPSNLDSSSSLSHSDLDKWRRNVVTSSLSKPVVYVRFIDRLKPSILITTASDCSCLNYDHLELSMTSAEYDSDSNKAALDLFQLGQEGISCMPTNRLGECLCYLKLRLSDDLMVRDRLNRESKDVYKFQVMSRNSTTNLNIQVEYNDVYK